MVVRALETARPARGEGEVTPGWARTPIDVFIQAKLEQEGLTPSPEADRRTLIRRLSFDLIGLPPTPEEIESFVSDEHPGAYEHLVERLLGSPHYGERWGRHWLDVVHYGDTHGYDKDKRRDHAWPYRDYVIQSFNDDLPYGQFIREQVAGDVLEPGDPRGVIATGFIAAGPWDFVGHAELREGTVDKLKAQLIDRDDMLSNTMSTFVSLTVHCARCHDHKFDPIAQKDYYGLQAVFAGLDRGDRPLGRGLGLGPARPPGRVLAVGASHVYGVIPRAARPIRLLRRGDVEQPGDVARPGALDLPGRRRHAVGVRARCLRQRGKPPRRPGRVAGQSGQRAYLAVDRQSRLALSFRPGHGRYAQRFRPQRLVAQSSRIARLAGRTSCWKTASP